MRDDLQDAYTLIKAEEFDAALKILLPICRAEPDNSEAWWLAAFALQDERKIRHALKQVLRLKPDHQAARQKLAELGDEAPPPRPTPQPKASGGSGGLGWLLLVLVVVLMAGGGLAFFVIGNSGVANVENTFAPPTEAAQAEAIAPTWTAPPTRTPIPTATASPTVYVLPPTWTISPSPTEPTATWTLPPTQTNTPTATLTYPPTWTPSPTINPAAFNQTYWMGDGDGVTMEDFKYNGAYLRHNELPVRVYIDPQITGLWLNSANYGVNLLSGLVPMTRVDDPNNATMLILQSPTSTAYEQYCPVESAGCATIGIDPAEIQPNGDVKIISWVRIRHDALHDTTLMVHEMIHALGVIVHSPDPNDVMHAFYSQASDGLRLSPADTLIIQLLYSLPAIR